MHRFLVEPQLMNDHEAFITGGEARHLERVLRLGPGDNVEVSDGQGRAFQAQLLGVEEGVWRAKIVGPALDQAEPRVRVILAPALTKGEKMDWVIQKGTELGVHTFAPFASKRSVVKLTAAKAEQRRERWQRIAQEAAKQCGRSRVPVVEPVDDMSGVCKRHGQGLVLLPWEGEESIGLQAVLQKEEPQTIVIFIGPEGGFSDDEVAQAQAQGARVVTLGPRILRAETAALATVTMVLYEAGDLG